MINYKITLNSNEVTKYQGALDGAEGAEEEPLDHDPEVEVVPETGAAECEDSKNVD